MSYKEWLASLPRTVGFDTVQDGVVLLFDAERSVRERLDRVMAATGWGVHEIFEEGLDALSAARLTFTAEPPPEPASKLGIDCRVPEGTYKRLRGLRRQYGWSEGEILAILLDAVDQAERVHAGRLAVGTHTILQFELTRITAVRLAQGAFFCDRSVCDLLAAALEAFGTQSNTTVSCEAEADEDVVMVEAEMQVSVLTRFTAAVEATGRPMSDLVKVGLRCLDFPDPDDPRIPDTRVPLPVPAPRTGVTHPVKMSTWLTVPNAVTGPWMPGNRERRVAEL